MAKYILPPQNIDLLQMPPLTLQQQWIPSMSELKKWVKWIENTH